MSTPEPESMTREEYFEGIEALQKTEGWIIHRRMERLGWSFYIFQGNYRDLIKALHINYADFLIRFDVRNKPEMQDLLKEVMRKLHNFVASALMLVDHTRRLSRMYEGTQFQKEYDSETERRFASDPFIQFVHGLRHYTLHYDLPLPVAVLTSDHDASLRINFNQLRQWNGWRKSAKQYLETRGDNERIDAIAQNYYNAICEFHDWFFNRQKELHEQAFAEANALRQRLMNSKWHTEYT